MTGPGRHSLSGGRYDDRGRPLVHFDFEAIRRSAADQGRPLLGVMLDLAVANPYSEVRTLWIAAIGFVIYAGTMFAVHVVLIALLGWSYFATGPWYWVVVGTLVAVLVARLLNAPVQRVLRRMVADRRAGAISRAAIAAGLCGACGYPLDSLEPEADGCAVCPECGAAWRRRGPGVRP